MDKHMEAGITGPGEYAPAGEAQGLGATFSAAEVAQAFGVAPARVERAMAGEFGLDPAARVDSTRAQHLAEVLLVDEALDRREAALMQLGAFTPRADDDWGLGRTAPGEESDRFAATADEPDDDRPSPRSSHDPAQPTG